MFLGSQVVSPTTAGQILDIKNQTWFNSFGGAQPYTIMEKSSMQSDNQSSNPSHIHKMMQPKLASKQLLNDFNQPVNNNAKLTTA